MAKGKKHELRTDKTTEDLAGNKVATKENEPETNTLHFQSVRCSSKPRSPLGESSSMLIQEGNELEATNVDSARLKKDTPNEIPPESFESKEQKAELPCHSHVVREQASDQPPQRDSTTKVISAVKDSAPKTPVRTARKPRAKKTENAASHNRKVTDYFPIRRSNRKTKGELKNEEHKHLDDLIRNGVEDGMEMRHIEGKGRGVFAVNGFKKGDFVVEYHGDLLDLTEAKQREASYAQDPQTGCYMYYFQYQCKTYCVDATKESGRLGRLINHSKAGNCQTKLHAIDGSPHLILVASKDIEADEELVYDYGDRSKASIMAHPWLKH